jgi:hypothetical protein
MLADLDEGGGILAAGGEDAARAMDALAAASLRS